MFHRCRVRVAILARLWVQLFLVVFDPVGDAQEDPQSMQMVRVLVVRLGHSDQHLFGLGLAQDTRERLQKHLQVTFIQNMHIICLSKSQQQSTAFQHIFRNQVKGQDYRKQCCGNYWCDNHVVKRSCV